MTGHFRKSLHLKLAEMLVRCFYRIRSFGFEKLPKSGGYLLVPNHVTWVDAVVLQAAFPRPIRFLVFDGVYHQPLLNPIFRMLKAIPINPKRAKGAMQEAVERIRQGEVVCVFPEGELSRTGILLRLKRGFELIAKESGAPVVPIWLDQLWGSIFSYYGGKFFRKIPRHLPYPVAVAVGNPIPAEDANIATVRQSLLDLGEACYQERPLLKGHLAEACLRGLRHNQFKAAVVDGAENKEVSHGSLLAAAIALSRYIKEHCQGRRIAVVLPTGIGAIIANFAALLAGKVPVNLNFTSGKEALQAAMRIGQLEDAITASAFAKRFPAFPFPPNVIYLDELMPRLKPEARAWRMLVAILPWRILALLLHVPKVGDREEAVVLFTSGSSGEPKGVVLSHRNVLANVSQFSLMLNQGKDDSLLASLPFFHSFGCTVTLWYPLVEGIRLITYPNPLEVAKNAELIERYKITMILATPTFLRGYLKRAQPEQLRSVKLVVTGAERLPPELADAFNKRFEKEVMQGYGLTETSPVVSVNLPEPFPGRPGDSVQPSSRAGSVGKMAPGITARIRDPQTDMDLSLHEKGMLWLRGANIFEHYLHDPARTADVLHERWFKTGDLARFDEDGFLYIEGRMARFSKIGGEMVPHETVETKIYELLDLPKDERVIAVTAVPDEAKGEALVVLSTLEISANELRTKLSDAGLPNLWIPRKVVKMEKIPVLGTGKLDLQACRAAAQSAAEA